MTAKNLQDLIKETEAQAQPNIIKKNDVTITITKADGSVEQLPCNSYSLVVGTADHRLIFTGNGSASFLNMAAMETLTQTVIEQISYRMEQQRIIDEEKFRQAMSSLSPYGSEQ